MSYGTVIADTLQSGIAGSPPAFKDINGVERGQLARAWVNFNGTGTVAIRASFNVSSITDNGVGSYTVNFTNAFADTNFSIVTSTNAWCSSCTPQTVSTAVIGTFVGSTGAALDNAYVLAAAFR